MISHKGNNIKCVHNYTIVNTDTYFKVIFTFIAETKRINSSIYSYTCISEMHFKILFFMYILKYIIRIHVLRRKKNRSQYDKTASFKITYI